MESSSRPEKFSSRKELKLHSDLELIEKPVEGNIRTYEF